MTASIPFNRPYVTGREFEYIREAIARAHLASGGLFSCRCEAWLQAGTGCARALLSHSCTAALEMAKSSTEWARKMPMMVGIIYGLTFQALALSRLGRHDEAIAASDEAISLIDNYWKVVEFPDHE